MTDEFQLLAVKYEIKNTPDYTGAELLQGIVKALESSCFSDCGNKGDHYRLSELSSLKLPIAQIKIIRGSVEYVFNRDKLILKMFEDFIDSLGSGKTKEELDRETEEMFQSFIEIVRPFFNKLTHIKPRRRYLLIHELLQLAGYPFDSLQLKADDQAKAALIRGWFKRSKPI